MIKGNKKRNWTEQDKKDIVSMLYEGKSLVAIGLKYNRTHATIHHQLKKWGISTEQLKRQAFGRNQPQSSRKKAPSHKYDGIIYNLNRGRSYASYLYKEDQKKADLSKWLKKSSLQEA
jgi:IS30 family transposase